MLSRIPAFYTEPFISLYVSDTITVMYRTYCSHNVVPHKSHSILLLGSIIFVNGGFQETSCLFLSLKHKNEDNKNMSKSLCYFELNVKCAVCTLKRNHVTVFCIMKPCSLVRRYQSFGFTTVSLYPEERGCRFLWNGSTHLPNCIVS